MKRKLILPALLLAGSQMGFSQTNIFPSTGNVGIGELAPNAKLEFANTRSGSPANVKYMRFNDVAEAWDADGLLRQVWDVNVTTHYWTPFTDQPGLDFRVGHVLNSAGTSPSLPTTFNSVLKLSMNGDIGIGTTSPLSKMHIVGGTIRIENFAGGGPKMVTTNNFGELITSSLPTLSISGNNLSISGGNTITLPSAGSPTLTFSGTTLSVTGGSNVNLSSLKDNLGNHTATTNLNMAGKNIAGVANLLFSNGNQLAADALYNCLYTTHNFGVKATADNTYALDVSKGNSYGTVRCYSVYETSDKQFKSNINPIDNALSIIEKLEGVTYDFHKDDSPTMHDYGFIAQDVQKILPELVKEDSKGTLALNYRGIIPVLTEAMKQQQSIIEQQNLRIEKLEAAIENLTNPRTKESDGAILYQNTPNPFEGMTEIKCYVPANTRNAQIKLFNISGIELKSIPITATGEQKITINSSDLKANIYVYSLVVDGKLIDSKKMVVNK